MKRLTKLYTLKNNTIYDKSHNTTQQNRKLHNTTSHTIHKIRYDKIKHDIITIEYNIQ